jgi:hypothetical protein
LLPFFLFALNYRLWSHCLMQIFYAEHLWKLLLNLRKTTTRVGLHVQIQYRLYCCPIFIVMARSYLASWLTIIYLRLIRFICTGNVFQAYDFGRKGNLLRYGSIKPFEYHLGNITAPVFIFVLNVYEVKLESTFCDTCFA